MMIFELYKKIFPIIVFFTDLFVPERFGGYNVGPFNFVRPKYKHDEGLIQHEMYHSKQFWNHPIKYTLGRWLKYFKFLPEKWIEWSYSITFNLECEAYGYQTAWYVKHKKIPQSEVSFLIEKFAEWVVKKYNIKGYTKQDAVLNIRGYYLKFLNE